MHVFIYILFRDERREILIPLQLIDRTKLEKPSDLESDVYLIYLIIYKPIFILSIFYKTENIL